MPGALTLPRCASLSLQCGKWQRKTAKSVVCCMNSCNAVNCLCKQNKGLVMCKVRLDSVWCVLVQWLPCVGLGAIDHRKPWAAHTDRPAALDLSVSPSVEGRGGGGSGPSCVLSIFLVRDCATFNWPTMMICFLSPICHFHVLNGSLSSKKVPKAQVFS